MSVDNVDVFCRAVSIKPKGLWVICSPVRGMHGITIYDCFSSSILNHCTLEKLIDRYSFNAFLNVDSEVKPHLTVYKITFLGA